ncbi:GNAT family N-acetyltransferase [Streptomyces sp. NK08204]|uniref:GNAT family N-acetyltransferase n=1 Tax=Streptomyces sp. NK08204 TaxID=2873260 RepID=UPI0027E3107B|nr:GNAT family N-acetyltransferase [Streptomyces sp. NK08204]
MTTPRRATPADAEGITLLRSELILSRPLDATWLTLCRDQLAERLQSGGDARAYVVDAPGGGLATCALALVSPVLPAPRYPQGLAARIQAVATRPGYRSRGYAKAALSTLLDDLEQEGITLFELHASNESRPLYEALGFAGDPALMRRTAVPQQSREHHARAAATDDWDTIQRLADTFSRLDTGNGLQHEEQWTLQVLKLAEEVGEAAQAVIGARGTNPRKGHSHTWTDVQDEVADAVITGMVALARLRPDAREHFTSVLARKAVKFLHPHDSSDETLR